MVGGKKIKSENIEIAILIFKLLHCAGAGVCTRLCAGVESTDKQTDRHTHTDRHTESFFIVVVTRASVATSRHRHALHVYPVALGGARACSSSRQRGRAIRAVALFSVTNC